MKFSRKIQIALFILFLILILLSRLTGKPSTPPDSFTYMATADAILQGEGYLREWGRGPLGVPLLYPSLIAAGHSWFGMEAQTAAFLISVLSSTTLILLVFLWGGRRLGWAWGWVAVLLVAFNISIVFYGLTLVTESLFTLLFFSAAGLSYILLRKRSHFLSGLGAGGLMGLAILTKSVAWILPVIFTGWIGLQVLRRVVPMRWAISTGMALIVGVTLITRPVSWMTEIPGGGGELSGKKSLVNQLTLPDLRNVMERELYLAALTQAGDQFQVEVSQGITVSDLLITYGIDIMKRSILNLGLANKSLFTLIPWWILIWIPGGVIVQWINRDRNGLTFSLYILVVSLGLLGFYALAGAYTSAIGPERYTVPLIPFLILWATTGIREAYQQMAKVLGDRGWQRTFFKLVGSGMVILLLAIALFPMVSQWKRLLFLPQEKRWQKYRSEVIGEWIQKSFGPGQKIMAREPSIPYYAGGLWVLTPFEPIERVISFSRSRGVRLIIVRQDVESRLRPQLIPLLRRDFSYSGLRLVIGIPIRPDPSGYYEMVIYELHDGYKK